MVMERMWMMWRTWELLNSSGFRKICGRHIIEMVICFGTLQEPIKMFACFPEVRWRQWPNWGNGPLSFTATCWLNSISHLRRRRTVNWCGFSVCIKRLAIPCVYSCIYVACVEYEMTLRLALFKGNEHTSNKANKTTSIFNMYEKLNIKSTVFTVFNITFLHCNQLSQLACTCFQAFHKAEVTSCWLFPHSYLPNS